MEDLRVLFNTAGNDNIGMGHIYTCSRIGNKFKEKYSSENLYLIPRNSFQGIKKLNEFGYNIRILESDDFLDSMRLIKEFNPNIIINDVIYVKEDFMKDLRENTTGLIVNIEHIKEPKSIDYADIIFSSIYPPARKTRTEYYYGPKYACLNESFRDLPRKKIEKEIKNFLISFGGSDPSGFTINAIDILDTMQGIKADIILGPGFNHYNELNALLEKIDKNKFRLINSVNNLLPYMLSNDIGLVSGGNTIYELAATGTPGIALSQNDMEKERTKLFSDYGIILDGDENGGLIYSIKKLMNDYGLRKKMSRKGQELVDGKGIDRVVEIIFDKLNL